MTATAAQIEQVRRMVNEPSAVIYDDTAIQSYIEAHPLVDERGQVPYTYDNWTTPPTRDDNENWLATYDLHAAAADIWEEKAAAVVGKFDFSADGASFSQSQIYEQYMKQARRHRARCAITTITMVPWARSIDDPPGDADLSN